MYNKQLKLKADRPISRFATVHKYGSPSTCARVVNSHGLFLDRERLLALHFVIQARFVTNKCDALSVRFVTTARFVATW